MALAAGSVLDSVRCTSQPQPRPMLYQAGRLHKGMYFGIIFLMMNIKLVMKQPRRYRLQHTTESLVRSLIIGQLQKISCLKVLANSAVFEGKSCRFSKIQNSLYAIPPPPPKDISDTFQKSQKRLYWK